MVVQVVAAELEILADSAALVARAASMVEVRAVEAVVRLATAGQGVLEAAEFVW